MDIIPDSWICYWLSVFSLESVTWRILMWKKKALKIAPYHHRKDVNSKKVFSWYEAKSEFNRLTYILSKVAHCIINLCKRLYTVGSALAIWDYFLYYNSRPQIVRFVKNIFETEKMHRIVWKIYSSSRNLITYVWKKFRQHIPARTKHPLSVQK